MTSILIYKTILYTIAIITLFAGLFYFKGKKLKFKFIIIWILICILYGGIIEKNLIFVQNHKITSNFNMRIGLISDVHVSFLKNKGFLKRVINRINNENLDLLLIAGDWTFFYGEGNHKDDLLNYLEPLKDLKIPTFGIIGNHDVGIPGPPVEKELIKTLKQYGVIVLDNNIVQFPEDLLSGNTKKSSLKPEMPNNINYKREQINKIKQSIYIAGLGEFWQNNGKIDIIKSLKKEDNVILLIHNPDLLKNIGSDLKNYYDIAFAGHLHAGQIRLPFIYKLFLPTEYDFDDGFYDYYKLYITSGIGEVGIPARFFNPPKIDIFEFVSKN